MNREKWCESHSWTWMLVVMLCVGLAGCADNGGVTAPTEEGVGTAAIALKMSATTAAELSRVEVVVTGADMDEIREDLEWDGNTATGTVTIPAGESRLFTLNAYDIEGDLRYTGGDQVDVVAGEETTVEITMRRAGTDPVESSLEVIGTPVLQLGSNYTTLGFEPSSYGNDVRILGELRNNGSAEATGVSVRVTLRGPDGGLLTLPSGTYIGTVPAGATIAWSVIFEGVGSSSEPQIETEIEQVSF